MDSSLPLPLIYVAIVKGNESRLEYFSCTGYIIFVHVWKTLFCLYLRRQMMKHVRGKMKRILCAEDDLRKN